MNANKCTECNCIIYGENAVCPQCGCPKSFFKSVIVCPECKKEIEDVQTVECPFCGYPIKQKKSKGKKWLITTILLLGLLVVVGVVVYLKITAPQRTIAKYTKIAEQYKKSLHDDAEILIEVIDTATQKIVYHLNDNILIHDYATGNTKSLVSTVPYNEDYECRQTNDFCICKDFTISDSKLIGDRLFLIIESCNDGYLAEEGVGIRIFYVNMRDDSFHYVVRCAAATFESQDMLNITTYYSGLHQGSIEERTYRLSTGLTDDEYRDSREEQIMKSNMLHNEIADNEREKMIEWLQGTWEWRGRIHIYGNQYENVSCRLVIDGDFITFYGNSGINDQGRITDVDFAEEVISFGNHSSIDFNQEGKILYYCRNKNQQFVKVSSNSVRGYSNNGGSDSRLMSRFNRLNEEGHKLLDEIGQYYYSGQAGPWVITDVYRLKQIQDEKISLAQEMGDRQLEALCRQQKAQTLIALRQMGF